MKLARLKQEILSTLLTRHSSAYHRELWKEYVSCLDTRSYIAGPIMCIFGILRALLITSGTDGSMLTMLILCRIPIIVLIAMTLKWRKLNRFYLPFELLTIALEGILVLDGTHGEMNVRLTLLYLVLLDVIVLVAFHFGLLISLIQLAAQTAIMIVTLHLRSKMPPELQTQTLVYFGFFQLLAVMLVHFMINRIGFFHVNLLVKMMS